MLENHESKRQFFIVTDLFTPSVRTSPPSPVSAALPAAAEDAVSQKRPASPSLRMRRSGAEVTG